MVYYLTTAIIIAAVLCFIGWYWWDLVITESKYYRRYHIGEAVFLTFLSTFIGFFVWVLVAVLIVSGLGQCIQPLTVKDQYKTHLSALNTGQDVQGRFFLGSGYVNSEPVFSYLIENDRGGYELKQVRADGAVVFEFDAEDNRTPYMETTTYERVNPDWLSPINPINGGSGATYEFYVPAGSVLTGNYTVQP